MDGINVTGKIRKNYIDYKNRHIKIYMYSDKTETEELAFHEHMLKVNDEYRELYEDFCKKERIKQRKEKLERICQEQNR